VHGTFNTKFRHFTNKRRGLPVKILGLFVAEFEPGNVGAALIIAFLFKQDPRQVGLQVLVIGGFLQKRTDAFFGAIPLTRFNAFRRFGNQGLVPIERLVLSPLFYPKAGPHEHQNKAKNNAGNLFHFSLGNTKISAQIIKK